MFVGWATCADPLRRMDYRGRLSPYARFQSPVSIGRSMGLAWCKLHCGNAGYHYLVFHYYFCLVVNSIFYLYCNYVDSPDFCLLANYIFDPNSLIHLLHVEPALLRWLFNEFCHSGLHKSWKIAYLHKTCWHLSFWGVHLSFLCDMMFVAIWRLQFSWLLCTTVYGIFYLFAFLAINCFYSYL